MRFPLGRTCAATLCLFAGAAFAQPPAGAHPADGLEQLRLVRAEEPIEVKWSEIALSGDCAVRDLWAKKELGKVTGGQTFKVAPHASAFYRITPATR